MIPGISVRSPYRRRRGSLSPTADSARLHRDLRACPVADHEFDALVGLGGTIVILMGMANLNQIVTGLGRAGLRADTPAAVIERGFSDAERTLLTTLDSLTGEVLRMDLCSPAVVIIGEVVTVAPEFSRRSASAPAGTGGRPCRRASFVMASKAVRSAASAEVLRGFRIGGKYDRRSADLIALEARGARVMHAPALMIAPNDQDGSLIIETRELIMAGPEVVLVTTGYGMRRWLEVADTAGLGAELTAALENARIFARGPKAHGAVRAAGLLDAQPTTLDTTASLVDAVIDAGLTDRRVAIQLHGYTDEVQLARLREASASVLTVTPYRWIRPTAQDRLPKLISAACRHQLDAVTFTSAPAAEATLETAAGMGALPDFVRALSGRVTAAAVGPVTAGPLREAGIAPVIPERYRLGALIRLVSDQLTSAHARRFRCGERGDRASRPGRDGRRAQRDPRPARAGPVHRAVRDRRRAVARRTRRLSPRGAR